jgi:hypothetical protein
MEDQNSQVVNQNSQGIFRFSNWKKEGDGLLIAAKALREQWLLNKDEVRQIITDQVTRSPEVFTKDHALARSSMLLLGYAVEMYLKGGLVKLYRYCPEKLVERELRVYGHQYELLAKRLGAPIAESQYLQLKGLAKSVVDEARYPVTPTIDGNFFDKLNSITRRNQGQSSFESLIGLVERIRDFVTRIDSDSDNPSSIQPRETLWGYYVVRYGGHLASSIVFRCADPMTLLGLRNEIEAQVTLPGDWEEYEVYQDTGSGHKRKCERRV